MHEKPHIDLDFFWWKFVTILFNFMLVDLNNIFILCLIILFILTMQLAHNVLSDEYCLGVAHFSHQVRHNNTW